MDATIEFPCDETRQKFLAALQEEFPNVNVQLGMTPILIIEDCELDTYARAKVLANQTTENV